MEPLEMPVEAITPEVMKKCTTPVSDDHDEKYGVPSLEELGMFWDCFDILKQVRCNLPVKAQYLKQQLRSC